MNGHMHVKLVLDASTDTGSVTELINSGNCMQGQCVQDFKCMWICYLPVLLSGLDFKSPEPVVLSQSTSGFILHPDEPWSSCDPQGHPYMA